MKAPTAFAMAALACYSVFASDGFVCNKIGAPRMFYGQSSTFNTSTIYSFSYNVTNGEMPKLVANQSQTEPQYFQMYKCSPPSEDYPGSDEYGTITGQLRSTKDTDMCVTAGNIVIHADKDPLSSNLTYIPNKHLESVTLQPCAKKDSHKMRRQWFKTLGGKDEPKRRIALDGILTDVSQSRIIPFGKNTSASLVVETNNNSKIEVPFLSTPTNFTQEL